MLLKWILISTITTATVYNAEPAQCNSDYTVTASGYKIDTANVHRLRIVAMERTMMEKFFVSYGDTIYVKCAGPYEGEWLVHDTMNKKYAGQHRIDFLVPNNVKSGKWSGVCVYKRK